MFENFDEDLFNLRILQEKLDNFEKFLENLINSFNCFAVFKQKSPCIDIFLLVK